MAAAGPRFDLPAHDPETEPFWDAARAGKLWLDGLRQPTLDERVPQVGAPTAWAAGLDGSGVTVAVLDTGIDATHPDLVTQVGGERNFVEEFEDGRDLVGHGTHVASIVAGSPGSSPPPLALPWCGA